jgi:hypothetical protein
MLSGKRDACDHVSGPGTAHNQRRVAIDHGVPDGTGGIVIVVTRT